MNYLKKLAQFAKDLLGEDKKEGNTEMLETYRQEANEICEEIREIVSECDESSCCQDTVGRPEFRFEQLDFSHLSFIEYTIGDLSNEKTRVYVNPETGFEYVIEGPIALVIRNEGKTHRVVDARGIVHCVPRNWIIQWLPKDPTRPVNW